MPYIDQTLPVNGYHQKPLIDDAPLPNQLLHGVKPQKANLHSTERVPFASAQDPYLLLRSRLKASLWQITLHFQYDFLNVPDLFVLYNGLKRQIRLATFLMGRHQSSVHHFYR